MSNPVSIKEVNHFWLINHSVWNGAVRHSFTNYKYLLPKKEPMEGSIDTIVGKSISETVRKRILHRVDVLTTKAESGHKYAYAWQMVGSCLTGDSNAAPNYRRALNLLHKHGIWDPEREVRIQEGLGSYLYDIHYDAKTALFHLQRAYELQPHPGTRRNLEKLQEKVGIKENVVPYTAAAY